MFALGASPLDAPPLVVGGLVIAAWAWADESRTGTPGRRRLGEGALRGLIFGSTACLFAFRFVPEVVVRFTPLPLAGGVAALAMLAWAQGLVFAIAGLVFAWLRDRPVPTPFAFALALFVAGFVPAVFPFSAAGLLTPWPALVQLAEIIGERGVTFVVALGAGVLASALARASPAPPRRRAATALLGVLVFGALLAHGHLRMGTIDRQRDAAPRARVALVDPAIDARQRWDPAASAAILARLVTLTREAEARGAELTVWTESAYPYVLDARWRRVPGGGANPLGRDENGENQLRGPVLFGAIVTSESGDSYNAALVARADGPRDGTLGPPYEKLHLLWFGETVPFADLLPWVRRTFLRGVGLTAGDAPRALAAGPFRAGVLVCFEDTLTAAGREAASVSPNLLVNVTNDAWFVGSQESPMHLRLAALRAVEARRELVRAVNLGSTSWVDAAGRVRALRISPTPGLLDATPALLEGPPTFYARFGDLPLALTSAVTLVLLLVHERRASRATTRKGRG